MNQSRLASSLLLAVFLVSGLSAQDAVLTGRITDATSGDPLPGANVVVVNTLYGGATDVEGNYSFSVPATGQEAEVTARFIGYFSSSANITLSAGTVTQDFALNEDVLEMEAVIVTGLVDATPRTKSPLSTGQISGEMLERVPGASPASALYGKVAGVKVVQGGGQPGDSPSVLLRGPTSINASGRSQDPLYIIDGVVIDPSVSGSPLADIPGDEIASIEVVKGAAGASMYGARAANGVIQIRTKRGNGLAQNQTRIKFRSEYGTNDLPKTLEPNMSHAYLQNSSGDFIDGNGDVVDPRATSGRQSDVWNDVPGIEFYDNAYKWVSTGEEGAAKVALPGNGYNQFRRFFKENSEVNQTLTISRNMESTNFSVSLGNLNKEGILSDIGGYGRQNVRVNVDHKFRNNLNIGFTTMVSQSERDAVSSTFGGFYAITFMAPDADLTMTDPATAGLEQGPRVYIRPDPASVEENPLYFLKYNDRDNTNRRVMSSFSIRYNPVDWAHITGSLSYDRANQNYDSFYPIGYTNISGSGTAIDGRYIKTTSADMGLNGDLKFMATREFGNITAKVTGSTMFEQTESDGFDADGRDFAVGGVRSLGVAASSDVYISSWQQDVRGISNMGGVMLDYNDAVIVDAFFRKEGSSLFGADNRYHNYSRFAGALRVTELVPLPMFNELKLRFTQGTAGSRPRFTARFETWNVSGGVVSKGNLGNKSLIPEFAKETEMGFDATLMDRFSISATYVTANTENQILYVPLPGYAGYGSQWQNAGTLDNKSFEAEVSASLVNTPSLSWEMGLTYYTQIKSEISKLDIAPYRAGVFYVKEGEPIGSIWGAKWVEKLADLPDEATQSEFSTNDDGYVVWVGSGNTWQDGIGKKLWGTTSDDGYKWGIPIKQVDKSDDNTGIFVKLGETIPDFDIGLSNTIRFGGFEAYVLFDGQVGGSIYNNTNQWGLRELKLGMVDQAGKSDGDKKPGLYYANLYNVNATNSHFVEDGTYFKLRELSLRYSLNRNQLGNMLGGALSKISVGVIGRNLMTWSDYTGYDPEVGSTGFDLGSAAIARYDGFGYPNFRTITGVFEIEF